jgi:alginate O-acetyltransferase complex protein AlgI
MLFSSPTFFVFFACYFILHCSLPRRFRTYLIIAGSTVFYAWWKIDYVWIPFALSAVAYAGVSLMERTSGPAWRRRWTIVTIVVLFLPLLCFKYADFFYRNIVGVFFARDGKLLDLPLPLGVSFVTFTLTAYIVDIYRRKFPSGHKGSTLLAYVLFFPHLIAGPILRPVELIPQLDHPRRSTVRRIGVPLAIFTMGLVKKLVFADQIAETVDTVFSSSAGTVSGPSALLAIYGFSVQIYCDFSGYTDMAIGIAMLLGVHLPNNFRSPYAANSLIDFWRRWHITLSLWLRDYLYIPLGGSRRGKLREAINIFVTMALGGLWHGANWTFVVWGMLHGGGISFLHLVTRVLKFRFIEKLPNWICVVMTFHFVTFAWIFFRAPTLSKAAEIFAAPFTGGWENLSGFAAGNIFAIVLVVLLLTVHRFDDHRRIKAMVRCLRAEILWPLLALLWALAIAVSQGSSAKFIYFDF